MKKNTCVVCESNRFKLIMEKDGHEIVSCKKCGLVKTLQNKSLNYSNYHRDTDYDKFESHFKNIFRKRFNLVNKYKKGKRVCDIGASTGTMLDVFLENNWETWGVEPSASAHIAKKKGHKVLKNTLEKAMLPSNYFDAVVLNHTLEHVENPVEVLKKVSEILKKGGVVLVDVPNFDSLSSNIRKGNWPFLLPNEHTYQFTPESLKKVFEKARLSVIHQESRSGIFEFANPLAEIFESLITLKKRFFVNLIELPSAVISTALNKGNSMTMMGKKI